MPFLPIEPLPGGPLTTIEPTDPTNGVPISAALTSSAQLEEFFSLTTPTPTPSPDPSTPSRPHSSRSSTIFEDPVSILGIIVPASILLIVAGTILYLYSRTLRHRGNKKEPHSPSIFCHRASKPTDKPKSKSKQHHHHHHHHRQSPKWVDHSVILPPKDHQVEDAAWTYEELDGILPQASAAHIRLVPHSPHHAKTPSTSTTSSLCFGHRRRRHLPLQTPPMPPSPSSTLVTPELPTHPSSPNPSPKLLLPPRARTRSEPVRSGGGRRVMFSERI